MDRERNQSRTPSSALKIAAEQADDTLPCHHPLQSRLSTDLGAVSPAKLGSPEAAAQADDRRAAFARLLAHVDRCMTKLRLLESAAACLQARCHEACEQVRGRTRGQPHGHGTDTRGAV